MLFVDTSGWANLYIPTENYHLQTIQCFQQARQQRETLITTNYVVAELVALFNSPLRVPRLRLFENY